MYRFFVAFSSSSSHHRAKSWIPMYCSAYVIFCVPCVTSIASEDTHTTQRVIRFCRSQTTRPHVTVRKITRGSWALSATSHSTLAIWNSLLSNFPFLRARTNTHHSIHFSFIRFAFSLSKASVYGMNGMECMCASSSRHSNVFDCDELLMQQFSANTTYIYTIMHDLALTKCPRARYVTHNLAWRRLLRQVWPLSYLSKNCEWRPWYFMFLA